MALAMLSSGAASAATIDLVATGAGIPANVNNNRAATVEFTLTYQPFTDGFNNPACETSVFSCLSGVAIDLRGGLDTNATASNARWLGFFTIDRDEVEFSFSSDNSVLFLAFDQDIFDPGNQLTFSASIRNLGNNGGDAFELRGVTATFSFFGRPETPTAVFVDNGPNSSIASVVAPIPLPAGAVLLLTGLGGLVLARRRRAAA